MGLRPFSFSLPFFLSSLVHQVPKLFAYGNTTVLCWGRVHPDPAFYSALHVFPIGDRYLYFAITLSRGHETYINIWPYRLFP